MTGESEVYGNGKVRSEELSMIVPSKSKIAPIRMLASRNSKLKTI